jgi:putative ABC transport system permease protein
MRDYLLFIVKNALRSKRRAFLTMASVALSFCLLAVLMALYHALFLSAPATPGQALRLVVHHKVSLAQGAVSDLCSSTDSRRKRRVSGLIRTEPLLAFCKHGPTIRDQGRSAPRTIAVFVPVPLNARVYA